MTVGLASAFIRLPHGVSVQMEQINFLFRRLKTARLASLVNSNICFIIVDVIIKREFGVLPIDSYWWRGVVVILTTWLLYGWRGCYIDGVVVILMSWLLY